MRKACLAFWISIAISACGRQAPEPEAPLVPVDEYDIWVPEGDRTPWLKEGGKGQKPIVVHFQVRPDPLAK